MTQAALKLINPFLICIGALWLSSCGAPNDSAAVDWPAPSPAIWEANGPDGAHLYLMGTIHALPAGVEWRTPAFEEAFANADILIVEIGDLGSAEDARMQFERRAYSEGLPPLMARIPRQSRESVDSLLEKTGFSAGDFDETETWAAAMQLSNAVRTGDPENGVDRALIASGKRVKSLESYASQFDRFDRLSDEAQSQMLLDVAEDASLPGRGSERIEAWLTGDLDTLQSDSDRGILSNPELRGVLQTERNHLFVEKIRKEIAATGKVPFVAVGAVHMLGPDGLPALLNAEGYTLRRLQ